MSKLEELIEKWQQEHDSLRYETGDTAIYAREKMNEFITDLQSLTSSHREEIEAAYLAGVDGDTPIPEIHRNLYQKDASDYYEKTFGK